MKRAIAASAVVALMTLMIYAAPVTSRGGHNHPSASSSAGQATEHTADSVSSAGKDADRYSHLTDEDFEKVARELGVETAAIKAVVSIEAGAAMKGFWAPGVPVINFDRTMYNKYASKAASKAGDKNAVVPEGLSGYALKEWTQLTNARRINAQGADMGTFWGMFQIGGFCYKLCGCESVEEMVSRMSYSEFEQLELFAAFIRNTGYINDLRVKNWASFSRKYNGPGYARRGYHTKMAAAYSRFKAQESKNKPVNTHATDAGIQGKTLKIKQP